MIKKLVEKVSKLKVQNKQVDEDLRKAMCKNKALKAKLHIEYKVKITTVKPILLLSLNSSRKKHSHLK